VKLHACPFRFRFSLLGPVRICVFISPPLIFLPLPLFFEFVDGGSGWGFFLGFYFGVGFLDLGFLN